MIATIKTDRNQLVMASLGIFRPDRIRGGWDASFLKDQVRDFTFEHGWMGATCCSDGHITVRKPGDHHWAINPRRKRPDLRTSGLDGYPDWHHDGSNRDIDFFLGMWSTTMPTELWYGRKIYIPEPLEFVVIWNPLVWHRSQMDSNDRWFIRDTEMTRRISNENK